MGAWDIEAEIVCYAVFGWLGAMAFLVAYRCLHGGINLNGLLARSPRQATAGIASPERVQLLFAFLVAVIAYARLVLKAAVGGHALTALPPVPNELIALFIGSHTIYLGGKLGWMFNLQRFITKTGE